jgi:hypothetical protein
MNRRRTETARQQKDALAALKGDKTMVELSEQFDVSALDITYLQMRHGFVIKILIERFGRVLQPDIDGSMNNIGSPSDRAYSLLRAALDLSVTVTPQPIHLEIEDCRLVKPDHLDPAPLCLTY